MIEEPIDLRDVEVVLRADSREPSRVYLALDETDLPFEVRDGYIHTTVLQMSGHAMVVFDE